MTTETDPAEDMLCLEELEERIDLLDSGMEDYSDLEQRIEDLEELTSRIVGKFQKQLNEHTRQMEKLQENVVQIRNIPKQKDLPGLGLKSKRRSYNNLVEALRMANNRVEDLEQKVFYTESKLREARNHRDNYMGERDELSERLRAAEQLIFNATRHSDPSAAIDKMLRRMEDKEC